MWKSKKFILILTLAILALVGGTTGAVMAATDDGADTQAETQAETQHEALLNRICEIYEDNTEVAIDPDELQAAFDQAREELRQEALEERLAELMQAGEISQEEADEFLEWWQSKPDIELEWLMGGLTEGPMGRHHRGGMMGGGHFWGRGPYCSDTSGDETST